MINERLSKIINLRLKSSLEKCVFYPYGSEIWIFDEEELNWLMILNSEGQLSYNKKFFNELFACFSFRDREYQPYLKLWIEKLFRIPIRSLRRTSGMDYLVESMFNDKKKNKIWEINKRFEFGFEIVKRYLELKKINDKVHLELFMS